MTLNDAQLKYFADFIEKELGIVYSQMNYFQLDQRIEKIANFLKLKDALEVYHYAISNGIHGDFKQQLLDIATNNETSFFRDPKIFQALEKNILPQILTASPKPSLYRIWCAAASFGQEPFSVGMLAHEFSKANPGGPRFEIIATDIADHALKRCNEATYTQLEIQRGLSASRISQYFTQKDDHLWTLKSEVRNLLQFKKQNLLDPFSGMGMFNVILCRYVLIYQDPGRKKMIMEKLERCLNPGGYLILGASESALGLSNTLEQINFDGAIVYQKK